MAVNKIIGSSAKVAGGLMIFFGLITLFGIMNDKAPSDPRRFSIHILVGPTLIYLGLKLLDINW